MPTILTPEQHLDLLRHDIARVLTLRDADRNAPVPGCPGWSLDDLLGHCAGVFTFAANNLAAAPGDPLQDRVDLPEGRDHMDLFEDTAEALVDLLDHIDPVEHRPNWAGAPTAEWYFRRMAQELAVHRWDAQQAVGDPEPIGIAQAADGIEEWCDTFFPFATMRGITGNGETVHLHATDTEGSGVDGGEWMFTFTADGVDVERTHGKGDMAGRGPAAELLLFTWGRRPVDITTFGEPDLLAWWASTVNQS